MSTTFTSNSGQLKFELLSKGKILRIEQRNMRIAGLTEYLDFVSRVGDALQEHQTGSILFDITNLSHYDLTSRAAAVKELNRLLLSKAPYLLLAVVKGGNLFENLATQAAISAAKPISKKFLDGRMFDSKEEALAWLYNFKYPDNLPIHLNNEHTH